MIRTALNACLLVLAILGWADAQTPAPASGKEQPLYVFLYTRIDDHINHELTEDRINRTVANLERIRAAKPKLGPSCVFLVSGASAEMLAERDGAMKHATKLKEGAARHLWEIGYDGENEPTHLVRPLPNFRNAKTSEERFKARLEAYDWFLNDYKHRLTGEPDASRPGGLRLAQQVFGPVATVGGIIPNEVGGDTEVAHLVSNQNRDAILPGIPENDTWPIRNLDGLSGSIPVFSQRMSPGPNFAPELYFMDDFLRVSNITKLGARTVIASGGPDAFKNLLKVIDRSKVHVIKVYLGDPANYVKPDFNRGIINPLRWAYENPKRQRIMLVSRLTDEEVEANYAKETALLNYLVDDFFAANPGSRFISSHELKTMAQTATGKTISLSAIREATQSLVKDWDEIGTNPPDFARSGEDYFSLADMFYLLSHTLGGLADNGKMPESVTLKFTYGPTETPDVLTNSVGALSREEVAKTASVLAKQLHANAWTMVPANRIPGWITCSGVRMNAAEFLRLMSDTLLSADGAPKLAVRQSWMLGPATEGYPRNRMRWEEGGMWTVKPAPLKLPASELSLRVP